ncbi:MAG: hypothetical protein ABIO92_01680 [Chloroflexia bacterium]
MPLQPDMPLADKIHDSPVPRPFPFVPLLLALIMAGGLLLRLIFLTASLPSRGFPFILDEGNYVDLAVPLSQGMGFVEKWVYLRPPGYPMFLAAMLLLSDGNLSLGGIVQVILSVLNIGVMYALVVEALARYPAVPLAKRRAVGLMSAGLMALNPHVVFYANLFMVETPYMLAFSLLLWLVLRALRAWNARPLDMPSRRVMTLMALAGVVAAAAILVRSLLLSFTPLLLAWFWWVLPRPEGTVRRLFPSRRWLLTTLLPIGLYIVAMFALILPWTVRNYLHYDRFMLVDAVGGLNLWQYNDKIGRDEVVARLAAITNPVDRDRYAMQQGQRAILADPVSFAKDAAERFGDSWSVEQFGEYRVSIKNKYPGVDCFFMDMYAWLGTIFYVGLGLLTLWGFVLAPGRTLKGLFLLVLFHYVATSMATHVEFRYRFPLYPFASLYAGWILVSLFEWLRYRRRKVLPASSQAADVRPTRNGRRKLALAVASLLSLLFVGQSALFALPGFANALRFERRYLEGKTLLDNGDYAGALASFEGAEQIDRGCACLYRNIGLAQGKLGNPNEERAAYATALSREADDWRTRALLSDRLRAAGDTRFAGPLRTTRPEFRAEQLRWAWDNLSVPPRSDVDIGGDDLGYITGFESFEAEPQPGGAPSTYRWTTDRSSMRLSVPSGDGTLKLRMRWHSLSWPGKPNPDAEVRVTVNGLQAGTLIAHPGWGDDELTLSSNIDGGPIVIELQTRAQRPPGPELRSLGVAVDWVKLERSN